MTPYGLMESLTKRGIRLYPGPAGNQIIVRPASRLTDDDRQAIRARKAELLRLLAGNGACHGEPGDPMADKALALLRRLQGYSLPAGRMPVARELARRMRGLTESKEVLAAAKAYEAELIRLGGWYDPALAEATALVTMVFPDVRLAKVGKLQQ
jgi:hypothetical protein